MHFCAHDRRGLPRRRAPAPFPKIERHSISSARKRRIKKRERQNALPSKSPFAKSPTDFFAASTRNDATRREERCAIFLLATVLAGAARNANFCADAATNEDMSITLTCVFWRSDAREKCRFPDWICVDYKSQSMMMMMDIYSTKRTTLEREKRRESVFFLPSFLFFFVWKDTRTDEKGKAQNDREKIL